LNLETVAARVIVSASDLHEITLWCPRFFAHYVHLCGVRVASAVASHYAAIPLMTTLNVGKVVQRHGREVTNDVWLKLWVAVADAHALRQTALLLGTTAEHFRVVAEQCWPRTVDVWRVISVAHTSAHCPTAAVDVSATCDGRVRDKF
jgi:hypothetical protein